MQSAPEASTGQVLEAHVEGGEIIIDEPPAERRTTPK
jgi:hypothetical protein